MSYLSDFLGFPALTAVSAIAQKDPIIVGPTGKAQKANVTDYASVANAGQITAQTTVQTCRILTGKNCGLQGADGSFYVASPFSGNNGCRVQRFSA